ncbi:hypothetical protein C2845_PM07G33990 [Panicum miliaceum]|uniref:Uncharacterized protein n=1 Tax=Panicum miliaceum TaxID=4540 RepID=A0A3L6SIJ2_PANMI|nr:hypothetical protein C2845_PM07G33990 [Panicum miliaceum]
MPAVGKPMNFVLEEVRFRELHGNLTYHHCCMKKLMIAIVLDESPSWSWMIFSTSLPTGCTLEWLAFFWETSRSTSESFYATTSTSPEVSGTRVVEAYSMAFWSQSYDFSAMESITSPSSSESATMSVARTNSSSISLELTYPPSAVAMYARRLGQSFMTCPMALQRWHTMLEEQLVEAPGESSFFYNGACNLATIPFAVRKSSYYCKYSTSFLKKRGQISTWIAHTAPAAILSIRWRHFC